MSESQFQVLFNAIEEGNLTKVKRLMKQEISVLAPDGSFSLFHLAAQIGEADIIKAMSASALGADVNTMDESDVTPMLMAAQNGHVNVINALCGLGADITTPTTNGGTPVLIAAQNNLWVLISILQIMTVALLCLWRLKIIMRMSSLLCLLWVLISILQRRMVLLL